MAYTLKAGIAARNREIVACDEDGSLKSWIVGAPNFVVGSNVLPNIAKTWAPAGVNRAIKVFETSDVDDNASTWAAGTGPQFLNTGGNVTTSVVVFASCREAESAGSVKTGFAYGGEDPAQPMGFRVNATGVIEPYFGTSWGGVTFAATYATQAQGALIAIQMKADGHLWGYYGPEGGTVIAEDLGAHGPNAAFDGRLGFLGLATVGLGDTQYRLWARLATFAISNEVLSLAELQTILDDPVGYYLEVGGAVLTKKWSIPTNLADGTQFRLYIWSDLTFATPLVVNQLVTAAGGFFKFDDATLTVGQDKPALLFQFGADKTVDGLGGPCWATGIQE